MPTVVKEIKTSRPYCLKAMRRTVVPTTQKGKKEIEVVLSVRKVLPKHTVADGNLFLSAVK